MRLKILFKINSQIQISINYNIFLSAVIYKFLNASNNKFAEFLHNTGYKIDSGKTFKLFTFSDLICKTNGVKNGKLIISSNHVEWFISSPIDEFIRYLVEGLFIVNTNVIIDNQIMTVDKVEVLQTPDFNVNDKGLTTAKFKMMSPMVLSTKKGFDGFLKQYYFRYEDDFSSQILQNLKHKYFLSSGKENNCNEISFEFDKNYIEYQLQNNRKLSKLRHINRWNKQTNKYEDIMIKGIFCPFEITTDNELIKIGYECGFGEKNSTGFGMVSFVE